MRARPSFAACAWAAATAAATLVSWAGVQIVTSAVTPSPVAVLPASRIAAIAQHPEPDLGGPGPLRTAGSAPLGSSLPDALHRGGTAGSATTSGTTATVASPPSFSSTGAPGQVGQEGSTPTASASAPATTTSPRPTSTTTGPSGGTTSAPPATAGNPSSPPGGGARAATYQARGGEVTTSCSGPSASLVNAVPADGYQVYVQSSGPSRVAVLFASQGDREWIVATCVNGSPQGQVEQGYPMGGDGQGSGQGSATTWQPDGTGPGGRH